MNTGLHTRHHICHSLMTRCCLCLSHYFDPFLLPFLNRYYLTLTKKNKPHLKLLFSSEKGNFQEKQCNPLLISQHKSMSDLLCTGTICIKTTENFLPLYNGSIYAKLPPYLVMRLILLVAANKDSFQINV